MKKIWVVLFLEYFCICIVVGHSINPFKWFTPRILKEESGANGTEIVSYQPALNSSTNTLTTGIFLDGLDSPSKSTDRICVREVVIIGSGPAGCTAAIYAGRAMLNPLVVAGYQAGGQLMLTSDVENFPGYETAVTGPELMNDLSTQAKKFGAEFWNTNCKSINTSIYPFEVKLPNCTVIAKAIILATGADALWLKADREEEFQGKGISTCATCDGFLFRGKPVLVIGGGDSAVEEALFLTRFASNVTLIHRRDSFKASKVMLQRLFSNPKIAVLANHRVVNWIGDNGFLTGANLENTIDGSTSHINASGAFIAIGHKPNTKFLGDQVTLDVDGFIKVIANSMTSVPGIFACGDVADKRYKQAITAAGSGCQAAIDVERWLESQESAE